jgi:hypothetical protein
MQASKYQASIEACAAHYDGEAEAVKQYLLEGEQAAYALDNRGPIKLSTNVELEPEIREAYSNYGFYVFTNVISEQEMADILKDMAELRSTFPTEKGAQLDSKGRPALGTDRKSGGLLWSKPLSDPMGGTQIARGRHQIKLKDLDAGENAPKDAPFILSGSLQFSDAALRLYAHPQLLAVAASINGRDFAPFNEVLFIKDPGLGAAVSWHQDGDTHWTNPDFHEDIHGFNFMAQVYGSSPVNGVWVVPGTHKLGKLDITKMVEASGSERIDGAVPIVCDPGDVVMCNRQLVHGSFANSGFEPRLTINFGFHKRSSVLNVKGAGIHSAAITYTDEVISERAKAIGFGISARQKQYPHELPYIYEPIASTGVELIWDETTKAKLKDYNALDLSI